jgi:hypothetical protein
VRLQELLLKYYACIQLYSMALCFGVLRRQGVCVCVCVALKKLAGATLLLSPSFRAPEFAANVFDLPA